MRMSKDTTKGSGEKSGEEPQEWKLKDYRAYI